MPELDDIRIFAEVVETGSLTRAGARLGLSKSVVSRRLARLEGALGMPLVARTTRGLSLTEAGSDFRPHAERMIAEMQSARDTLSRQGEATGRLRLSAPLSFGTTHLAPMIAELALRNPRLAIDTSYTDRHVDLVGEGYDAAVRLGTLADSSLIARRIAPVAARLVASPAYLARAGVPRTPADLAAARGACRTTTRSGTSSATAGARPSGRGGGSPATAGRRSSRPSSPGSGSR